MQSEHRLHASAVLFSSAQQLKNLALPLVLAVLGASRGSTTGLAILVLFLAATLVYALLQYLSYRYRFEPSELVVRKGVLFRSERHIPYARVQSLDVSQNVLHRLLGVVAVRVQTAGANEPEAVLSALRRSALDDMRRCIFSQRREVDTQSTAQAAREQPAARDIFTLSIRELVITGLIELRGIAVIAAGLGLLWQVAIEPMLDRLAGEARMLRMLIAWVRGEDFDPARITTAIVGVLIVIALLSISWAFVRLLGFRLRVVGDDLQTEYGLFTRLSRAIPRRRIQSLTLREGPLHRVARRIAVEVETAGGDGAKSETERTRIAPVLRPDALPALLDEVAPDLKLDHLAWQPLAPRAGRRVFKRSAVLAIPVATLAAIFVGLWAFAVYAGLVTLAAVHARAYVRHARWSLTDTVVAFRHGWLWRRTTVARLAKVQVVTVHESPFDRRAGMARVGVDTAGASVAIPYLGRDTAVQLHATLATAAARTEFRW